MADEPGLSFLIKSLLDSKGFDDLQSRVQAAKGAQDDASSSANQFSSALSDMGERPRMASRCPALSGVAARSGFFKEALKGAIDGQQAVERFTAANAALGGQTAETTQKNQEWLESMQHVTGVGKEELVPMYQRLLASSQNVAAAQAGLQIASGAAARGFGDLGENAYTRSRYMTTGV